MRTQMIKVNASNAIDAIGYDGDTKRLSVRFLAGKKYVYSNVESNVAMKFANAQSKGIFFIQNIKSNYTVVRKVK